MYTLDYADAHWFLTGMGLTFEQASAVLEDMNARGLDLTSANLRAHWHSLTV